MALFGFFISCFGRPVDFSGATLERTSSVFSISPSFSFLKSYVASYY